MAIMVGREPPASSCASSHASRSSHSVPATSFGIFVSRQMMRAGKSSITKWRKPDFGIHGLSA